MNEGVRTLPIQKYNADLGPASQLVKRSHPQSVHPHHGRLTLLSLGLDAILQKTEASRGIGQTHNSASLEVKKSSVTHKSLE